MKHNFTNLWSIISKEANVTSATEEKSSWWAFSEIIDMFNKIFHKYNNKISWIGEEFKNKNEDHSLFHFA